jgi:hypothetical protein
MNAIISLSALLSILLLVGCTAATKQKHFGTLTALQEEVARAEQRQHVLVAELRLIETQLDNLRRSTGTQRDEALQTRLDSFYRDQGRAYIENIEKFDKIQRKLVAALHEQVEIWQDGRFSDHAK